MRSFQRADGYRATIACGWIVMQDGKLAQEGPNRPLRGFKLHPDPEADFTRDFRRVPTNRISGAESDHSIMVKLSTRILLSAALYLTFGLATTAVGQGAPANARLDSARGSGPLDSEPDWELTRDEDGIRSYEMQRDGLPLLSFKAEGIIDAPIDLVLSVILDAERSTEWISYLSESVVVRWIDEPVGYVQFARFDVPWPVKDRVFISRVALEMDPETYAAVLSYHPSDDRAEFEDAILGSATGTRYILRPIDGGARTIFIGIGIADPKGSIPKWLVNWVGGSWPHETIQALRRQVRKDDVFVMPLIEPLYTGFEIQPPHQLISADPPTSK
jgi:hypothetical protein